MKKWLTSAALVSAVCFGGMTANAGIVLDYSDDVFFDGSNAIRTTARNALEAAVADINAVLDLNLGAITSTVFNGNSGGGTNLNFNFSLNYENPTTGVPGTSLPPITPVNPIPANEIRVFVGMRPLGGNTLGQGGSGGAGLQISGGIGSGSVQAAVDIAEANSQLRRDDGPTIFNFSGEVAGANYSFDIGPTIGNLWFDNDVTPADDVFDPITGEFTGLAIDSDAVLDNFWHFDHTTPVESSKFDFYSVALHEVLHSIGFGGSDTWDSLVSGTDWLGTEATTEFGTGTSLIDAGGAHIATGIMSPSLLDGSLQEVAMSPSISNGTRKGLTALDVAFLRDLGYTTNVTAIPEPSSSVLIAGVIGVAVMLRRRKRAA